MKPLSIIIPGLLVAGSLLSAQQPRLLDAALLSSLRAEASRNHPSAGSAKLVARAAGRDIRALRLWDDPTLGVEFMAAEIAKRRDDGDLRLSYEQPLPKRGLYAATVSKADALRRAALENSKLTSLEIGAAAAKDAIELALADESIDLQSVQLGWLEKMTTNARQKTLDPEAISTDALRLETELGREKEALDAARRTRGSIAQRLNLRLGRGLESPWPLLRLPSSPVPVPTANSEIARISRLNPRVRAMRERASAAQAETRIADRERQPQFSVGVASDFYSGGDFRDLSVGLKMSLPFFNRGSYDAKIEASQLRETAAAKDIETVRLEVAAAVLTAVNEAANAAARAQTCSGEMYQQALAAAKTVESSWISSKATLNDLLESNRMLFSVRLEHRRFIAMQQAALEDLNLLVPNR